MRLSKQSTSKQHSAGRVSALSRLLYCKIIVWRKDYMAVILTNWFFLSTSNWMYFENILPGQMVYIIFAHLAPTPVWRQETPNCMISGVLTQIVQPKKILHRKPQKSCGFGGFSYPRFSSANKKIFSFARRT